jgi:toxin YoeB
LIEAITRDPYEGIGKPEPLRFDYTGYWSRRITDEHRLIYKVEGDALYIVQCRYHYNDS